MRIMLMLFMMAALVAPASLAQAPAGNRQLDGDLAAIRAAIDSYVEAFNAADAKRIAEHWADDAVYIRRDTGEKVSGKAAIEKVFEEVFAGDKKQRLLVRIDSIRLLTRDVAIEDGTAWVTSSTGEAEESTYTAVHVKKKQGWRLDSVRETAAPPKPEAAAASAYEHLKALEWMIGEWVDESEESTVETVCKWTTNKSFLTRTFRVSAGDDDPLEGTQVVGWDPLTGVIRSWVFDSDGGYLEGTWSFKGGSWAVKSSGYLSDGRKASSVNIYTPVDENSFTWKAVGRAVDGEFLPNIEEVKVVRNQATQIINE